MNVIEARTGLRLGLSATREIVPRLLLVAALGAGSSFAQTAAANSPAAKPVAVEEKASAIPWSVAASGAGLKLEQTPAPGDEQAGKSPKATNEGLKMHGWWVIEVRNSDGTVTAHREFENAIEQSGQAFLMKLMAGYAVPADYGIGLLGGPAPCSSGQGCYMVRSATSNPGSILCLAFTCSQTLTYAFNISNTANSSMVLSGYAMASQAGSVSSVHTYAGPCPAFGANQTTTVDPATCLTTPGPENGLVFMTGADLATPVPVASGQIIQVSVTITFS
jgi:hypothetical protein